MLIAFIEKPPICAVPFDPKIETDPSKSLGRVAMVASIIPKAPLLNFKFTMTVSKLSILANAFMPYALTYFTLPPCNLTYLHHDLLDYQ